MNQSGKAVVTVLGRDRTGIIARVSGVLFERGANIVDIAQTVLSGTFSMTMIVEIDGLPFDELADALAALGEELGLQIRIQRSEIFDAMHRV